MFASMPRFTRELVGLLLRRPVLAAAVVGLDSEGRVVLIRRRDTGTWGLPGGVLRYGERVAEAAARELREEARYTMGPVRRVVGVYSSPERDPRAHSALVVVEATVEPLASPPPLDRLEVTEVATFRPDELPVLLAHDGARLLADWKRGGPTVLD